MAEVVCDVRLEQGIQDWLMEKVEEHILVKAAKCAKKKKKD